MTFLDKVAIDSLRARISICWAVITTAQATEMQAGASAGHQRRTQPPKPPGLATDAGASLDALEGACSISRSFSPAGGLGFGAPRSMFSISEVFIGFLMRLPAF